MGEPLSCFITSISFFISSSPVSSLTLTRFRQATSPMLSRLSLLCVLSELSTSNSFNSSTNFTVYICAKPPSARYCTTSTLCDPMFTTCPGLNFSKFGFRIPDPDRNPGVDRLVVLLDDIPYLCFSNFGWRSREGVQNVRTVTCIH